MKLKSKTKSTYTTYSINESIHLIRHPWEIRTRESELCVYYKGYSISRRISRSLCFNFFSIVSKPILKLSPCLTKQNEKISHFISTLIQISFRVYKMHRTSVFKPGSVAVAVASNILRYYWSHEPPRKNAYWSSSVGFAYLSNGPITLSLPGVTVDRIGQMYCQSQKHFQTITACSAC